MIDDRIRNAIAEAAAGNEDLRDPPITSAIYLFVSFDLINSTLFKTVNQLWPLVLSRFYDVATREAQTNCPGLNVWKLVGDEVLFYKAIVTANGLSADLRGLHKALSSCSEALRVAFPNTTGILSVKATAWIAKVDHLSVGSSPDELARVWNDELLHRNIRVQSLARPEVPIDFVGQDIDAGFRVAQHSHRDVIVLGADLVMFMRQQTTGQERRELEKIKLVDFKELKGVWGGRPYPILWYFPDWTRIASTFSYDEELEKGEKYQSAVKHGPKGTGGLAIDFLDRVYENLGRDRLIKELDDVVRSSSGEPEMEHVYVEQQKLAELHCVAVCFNQRGEVLIARRPDDKKVAPGAWEFGCAQLSKGLDFEECMRRAYEEDFGIKLTTISRLPVSRYFIEGKRVPGLIFVAEANSKEALRYAQSKHTEVRWIDPAGLRAETLGGCVEDFEETLRLSLDYLKDRQNHILASDVDQEQRGSPPPKKRAKENSSVRRRTK